MKKQSKTNKLERKRTGYRGRRSGRYTYNSIRPEYAPKDWAHPVNDPNSPFAALWLRRGMF